MFKTELIKRLEEIPGDGEITDANGSELVDVEDSSYQDGNDDGPRDRVILKFEGD